ncbi:MAG: rod shape-determining protein MreC [Mariprofundus sp.]|nr:rod shape-determining protein MreC [Mariprofundus sp.]
MIITTRSRKLWLIAMLFVGLFALSRIFPGSSAMLAMWPALEVLHAPAQWWQSVELWSVERQKLHQQYLSAEKKLQDQARVIQEINSLREENRQLRKILEISNILGYRWHAAKVRGRSPDPMSQRLLLQVSNVSKDDVIVSSEGLVGVVDNITHNHATVRTIFDASLAVPVTIPGTALAALSRGQGDSLSIDFVPLDMAPQQGEILYTSGAGGLFPAGIAVALITDIQPISGQLFAKVTAQAMAHWQRDSWLAVASHLHASQVHSNQPHTDQPHTDQPHTNPPHTSP